MAGVEVTSLTATFAGDTASFDAAARRVRDEMGNTERSFGQSLSSISTGMRNLGGSLLALSAPAVGVFTGGIMAAMNFEEAMTNANTVLKVSQDELGILSDKVQALGRDSRAGPQQTAEAFYEIVSGVTDASTHMDILTQSIRLSEAGSASLTSTTNGLIAAMNAYNLEAKDAAHLSDVYSQAMAMGVGSMEEFVSALSPAAGMAANMGVQFEDLAGATAFLTSRGVGVSESVTQMTSIMTAFLRPNKEMTEGLSAMGFESGLTAVSTLGLEGAIKALAGATGGFEGTLAAALGRSEATRGAMALLDDTYAGFFQTFQDGMEGSTEAAHNEAMKSLAAQWDLFKSALQDAGIELGQVFLPKLTELVPQVTDTVKGIADWIEKNPELTRTIGIASVGVFGFGTILVGASVLINATSTVVGALGTAFSGMGSAIALATGVIGAATLGVGAGYLIYKQYQDELTAGRNTILGAITGNDPEAAGRTFDNQMENAMMKVSRFVGLIPSAGDPTLGGFIGGIANSIKDAAGLGDGGAEGGVVMRDAAITAFTDEEAWTSGMNDLRTLVRGVSGMGGIMEGIPEETEATVADALGSMAPLFDAANTGLITTHSGATMVISEGLTAQDVFTQMAGSSVTTFDQIKQTAGVATDGPMARFIGALNEAARQRTVALNLPVSPIMGFLATAGAALAGWLANIARVHTVTVNTVQTGATGGGGGGGRMIQQFASGTSYVMSGGMANIHEGEGIIPARGIEAGGTLVKPSPTGFEVSGGGGGMTNSNNTVTIIATDRTARQLLDDLRAVGIDLERMSDRDQQRAF